MNPILQKFVALLASNDVAEASTRHDAPLAQIAHRKLSDETPLSDLCHRHGFHMKATHLTVGDLRALVQCLKGGWQPIATAPTNADILLFNSFFKRCVVGWQRNSSNEKERLIRDYTHWQPLPPPPNESSKSTLNPIHQTVAFGAQLPSCESIEEAFVKIPTAAQAKLVSQEQYQLGFRDARDRAAQMALDTAVTWFRSGDTKLADQLRMQASCIAGITPL